MGTYYPKPNEIQRDWYVVDLAGQTVGRAASRIAALLRGKHKTTFTPHLDAGDFVVCINAEKVRFTGQKLVQKEYNKASRYLGHLKTITASEALAKKPELVIQSAVRRMLPRNPLGRRTFSKLKVYAGPDHPHAAQQPKPYSLS
ncbi:MAG: 50S ribosomal protein L13 [Myxococcales bacterium FL481]|nr:MAG: 50S ribosomal protein L13 [Myxococcales bacterium FL481]